MDVIDSIARMQALAEDKRRAGKTLALIPTMGALHAGHLSLVEQAIARADHVTVSIFVNPTQFGPREDFGQYPRSVEKDLSLLDSLQGVDAVFMPTANAMYPRGQEAQRVWVLAEELDRCLCGAFREGHFRGVTTVVAKLFHACKPHLGLFGLKDAQQFLILRRMVEDLNMGIELVGVPTYREADGLAASSRNVYLNERERSEAPHIFQALKRAREAVAAGERNVGVLRQMVIDRLERYTSGVLQYIEVVETDSIQPIERLEAGQEALIATAVFFSATRLIDNIFVTAPH
jgi:pantoate--beta-alanine ligase